MLFLFVSLLPCCKTLTKPHAANDRPWHEAAAALTFHSYFITCASPVAWSGPKAVRKVLSQHLAKDEHKGAQQVLEGATCLWNKIYQVPGTSLVPLIPESGASAQYQTHAVYQTRGSGAVACGY